MLTQLSTTISGYGGQNNNNKLSFRQFFFYPRISEVREGDHEAPPVAFQTFSRRAANKRKDCFQGGCRSYTQELHRDKEGSFFHFESCKATVAVKSENIKSEFDRVSVSLTKCCAFLLFFCLNKCYYFYYIIIISFQKCN